MSIECMWKRLCSDEQIQVSISFMHEENNKYPIATVFLWDLPVFRYGLGFLSDSSAVGQLYSTEYIAEEVM